MVMMRSPDTRVQCTLRFSRYGESNAAMFRLRLVLRASSQKSIHIRENQQHTVFVTDILRDIYSSNSVCVLNSVHK